MMRRSTLLSLAVLVWAAPSVGSADPVFEGSATNTWVVEEPGGEPRGVRVGRGRTIDARAGARTVLVEDEQGTLTDIPVDPQRAAVLINRTNSSWQPLADGGPQLALTGLDGPLFGLQMREAQVHAAPNGGDFDRPVLVRLSAVRPLGSRDTVSIRWSLDGGREVDAGTSALVTVAGRGAHLIRASAMVDGARVGEPLEVRFSINSRSSNDEDGDGVPDLVEIAYGGDALRADLSADRDGDGVSDLDEFLRGSDPDDPRRQPTDVDGDGWSDWDEIVRGTDPESERSKPTVLRRYGVETVITLRAHRDFAASRPLAGRYLVTAVDTDWDELVLRHANGGPLVFNRIEDNRAFRSSAERSSVCRIEQRDVDGNPLVFKAWLPALADVTPEVALAALEGEDWDAADWSAAFAAALGTRLVITRRAAINPRTSLAVGLVEAVVAAQAEPLILLEQGGGASAAGMIAVRGLLVPVVDPAAAGPVAAGALDALAEAYLRLSVAPSLVELVGRVDGIFSQQIPSPDGWTPTYHLADWLQLQSPLAAHLARLPLAVGVQVLVELEARPLAALLDPFGDVDGDGLSNADETLVGSNPVADDSDADGFVDGVDLCPLEAGEGCLARPLDELDTDRDGIIDAFDACPNVANPTQADANADGVPDACERYLGFIVAPRAGQQTRSGQAVLFEGRLTQRGVRFGATLRWTAERGDGLALGPVEGARAQLVFAQGGRYRVRLEAVVNGEVAADADWRTVDVRALDAEGPVVEIRPPADAVEGVALDFVGVAESNNGPIVSWRWHFGDDSAAEGQRVAHTFAGDGQYLVRLDVIDIAGETASAVAVLDVADGAPNGGFEIASGLDLEVGFSGFVRSVDPIVSWRWDFGDGTRGEGQNITHTYAQRGIYTVQLTVTDRDGDADLTELPVRVPSADVQFMRVMLTERWQRFAFPERAVRPVVVLGPPVWVGPNAPLPEVRAVGRGAFEARLASLSDAEFGARLDARVDVLVAETGVHALTDGAVLQAGMVFVEAGATADIALDPMFDAAPFALLTPLGAEGPSSAPRVVGASHDRLRVVTRARPGAVNARGRMVGYLAIGGRSGRLSSGGLPLSWSVQLTDLTSEPAAGDCPLSLSEPFDSDAEALHVPEKAAILRLGPACFAGPYTDREADPFVVIQAP